MAAIAEMRDKMERASGRARTILEEAKTRGRALTGEENLEVSALITEAKTLQDSIRSEESLEQKRLDLQNMDEFLNQPLRTVPHGINADDEDRKRLRDMGWEFKGGMAMAPTSLVVDGQPHFVPMFAEEVLFGSIPTDDQVAADFYRKTRAIFSRQYKSAYIKHFRTLALTHSESQAWQKLSGDEQKALSEGSDTAGGFLVPPDAQAEMLARVAQMSVMRQRARVQPTSSDILRWPAINANSNSNVSSVYSSGFVGGWVGETPAFSDTDPAFGTFNIPVKKLRVATKLSNDLIADAQVNILAFLAQNGSENMALVEDLGFINGNGGPIEPMGILNKSGINTVDVEGTTTNTISNNSTVAGSAPKIINLAYALPAQYTGRASWLMKRTVEGHIRALVAGSAGFLWPLPAGGGFGPTPRELMGYPIDNTDWMPVDDTDANKVIGFGDFSQYIIAQRAAITSRVLNERFADTDQVGIILFERVGGDIWNTDALRFGIV